MALMKKKEHFITLPINRETKIIIPLSDPVEYLGATYEEDILLFHYDHEVILSDLTIYHDMIDLVDLLKKALNQELLLHSSIISDIGYLYNNYHYDDTNFATHTFHTGVISWVGYLYHLWESTLHFDSWIYNKSDGSIIFEVTPFYPYMYCEPEEEPNYIPYEEWIKTYKPYFITTLSRETAEQWLEQAERIIKIVSDNEKRWRDMPKKDFDS